MKYICTKTEEGLHEIFTFANTIDHDCMFEVLCHIKDQSWGNWTRVHRELVSAGFVDKDGLCYGRSETLGVECRMELDTELLLDQ